MQFILYRATHMQQREMVNSVSASSLASSREKSNVVFASIFQLLSETTKQTLYLSI